MVWFIRPADDLRGDLELSSDSSDDDDSDAEDNADGDKEQADPANHRLLSSQVIVIYLFHSLCHMNKYSTNNNYWHWIKIMNDELILL